MNCEDFLMNKLARLDGEKTDLPAAEIDAHLEHCENCRREIEQMQSAVLTLQRQTRSAPAADLWAAVEKRIGAAQSEPVFDLKWQPFALVGALLVIYKLLELIPERDFGWFLKLAPFAVALALFAFLKENPFRINTELIPEK